MALARAAVALVPIAALAACSTLGLIVAHADTGHGPSGRGVPSHDFQLAARDYPRPQLNIHFGLSQTILLKGFNVAGDLRYRRFVFEYSHGMWLDYSAVDFVLPAADREAGLMLRAPWSTGLGIGYTLVDELYLMAELKAHRHEAELGAETQVYTTVSIGPALAWRMFLWRGLNLTAYLRYWPNVWTSAENDEVTFDQAMSIYKHQVFDHGVFGNLSLGWSFDL